jgi:hypothetical protein
MVIDERQGMKQWMKPTPVADGIAKNAALARKRPASVIGRRIEAEPPG